MSNEIYTLQEFMTNTKGLIYILMGAALVGFVGWWRFLTGRDEENKKTF